MAEPDISSILAALAAQRPAAVPAQPPYPTTSNTQHANGPQSYTPNPAIPTVSPTLGSFQLPQPTNSGSLDLSNIRPTHSGTVSIADAIAKARGFAAENAVSYDARNAQPQEHPNGRGYKRSRSRSRSPGTNRRENFRDNYNPYREERRDDRRGPGALDIQQESPYSPVARDRRATGGTLSPLPSTRIHGTHTDRIPAQSAVTPIDDNVETIQIDSSLVGLIIGRQGETLRRVESETGARVQFVTGIDVSGPTRSCKITGSRQSRNDAKTEIYRIIEENSQTNSGPVPDRSVPTSHQPNLREGEDSMQIMVPDRTVGLIIGRGGETIRDLQERSGCHVNIVGEQKSVNGLRPVNLIGSQQAASLAKDLIMEIVDSDTKTLAAQGQGPPPKDISRNTGSGNPGAGDRINDSIRVPSEAVGMIIGKGGETIKDMQSTTGCKINVSQQSGPGESDREIGLVGTRESIEQAKRAIEDKVEFVKRGSRNQQPDSSSGGSFGDRSTQFQQPYGQGQGQGYGQAQQSAGIPAQGGDDDPYAAYGGYNNYVAMWYAAMQQQQQQQMQQQQDQGLRDPPRPPGST
ncbi:MAG: hypothetical protein M1825_001111 [Sarcosagium campestre]|nr:MAG: hypothetical protein M1825_001111 [Sarcosagium campestre]